MTSQKRDLKFSSKCKITTQRSSSDLPDVARIGYLFILVCCVGFGLEPFVTYDPAVLDILLTSKVVKIDPNHLVPLTKLNSKSQIYLV